MTSIKIEKPFLVNIDTLEYEDTLPSLKLSLNCVLFVLGKKVVEINNEVWIACKALDVFIQNLLKVKTKELDEGTLEDLSGNILIKVSRIEERYLLRFFFIKSGTLGVGAQCEVNGLIDREEVSSVIEKLSNLDRWWRLSSSNFKCSKELDS